MFKRSLPRGYKFTSSDSISAEEAIGLWKAAEFINNPKSDHTALNEWDEALQESLLVLGVRDRGTSLIGMGTIDGDLDLAGLNHLAVHPNHRHKGIARTITKESVRIADQIGVQRLDVRLTEPNTLMPLYLELGFRVLDAADPRYLRREP